MSSPSGPGPILENPGDVAGDVLRLSAVPGVSGGGGSFFVDPERAQECIDRLRAVVSDLLTLDSFFDSLYCPPPGADPVSVNVALQGRVMANRARSFVETWRLQLERAALGLEQQLADYRGVEDENRSRFT
jgi:hypothetical protein